jgi:hypothetical protein
MLIWDCGFKKKKPLAFQSAFRNPKSAIGSSLILAAERIPK